MARPRGARARAEGVTRELAALYPDARCALHHRNAYELLVATILSAQCTDERVNMVTPALFARYPSPSDLAQADPDELEEIIRSTGFFRAKAKNLIAMAAVVEEEHGGEVPEAMDELVRVPGVGRKTANVVRSVWFGAPGLPVDTHVARLTGRLGLTREKDPVRIERDVGALVPPDEWGALSLRLIEHGRRVCDARRPRCEECVLAALCPSAGQPRSSSKPAAARSRARRAASTERSAPKSSDATAESGLAP